MLNHTAHAIPGGYAVAYKRPDGTLCAVMDCGTRGAAEREAQRLNEHQQAQHRAAQLAGLRQHAYSDNRRPVRWFEPDAFA
ncbi:hypothetical protein ACN9MJ_12760 [Acidovorax facilis]|uniref:hypothetical protein n=1 Tax=Acidovorax facilis TaxID=12917 RepID=UPI003CE9C15D